MPEVPVVKKRPRRANFPYEFKIAFVVLSLQPGACVAPIARETESNDNLHYGAGAAGKWTSCLPGEIRRPFP